jgi:hypothetical protein
MTVQLTKHHLNRVYEQSNTEGFKRLQSKDISACIPVCLSQLDSKAQEAKQVNCLNCWVASFISMIMTRL